MGWFGVGWGGDDDVPCTWTHLWCYGDDVVPCTWTHLWCYGELGWVGVGWGGDDDVPCTWTHLWCYGDDVVPCTWTHLWCYGELGWVGVGWVGMMTFLAHEHIFDATENWGGVGWGWWRSLHMNTSLQRTLLVQIQKNSSSRFCSIAQKAWHNRSAECFAVVQKWL